MDWQIRGAAFGSTMRTSVSAGPGMFMRCPWVPPGVSPGLATVAASRPQLSPRAVRHSFGEYRVL